MYYVYVWLDPRKKGPFEYDYYHWTFRFSHEPFYVGVSKGKTRLKTSVNRNRYFKNKVAKLERLGYKPILQSYKRGGHETVCFLEQVLIRAIGRWDKKRGPLVNFTEGGEGSWGRKLSPASIAKMKKSLKGRCTRSPEMCKRVGRMLKGRKHSKEIRNRMSAAQKKYWNTHPEKTAARAKAAAESRKRNGTPAWNKGRPRSKATRQKVSQSLMGCTPWNKKKWIIIFPDGRRKKVTDLKIYCDCHGLKANTLKGLNGKTATRGSCKGYSCHSC